MSDYKTREEIANEYGFSISTFKRKLKKYKLEVPSRERLDRSWQKTIYECVCIWFYIVNICYVFIVPKVIFNVLYLLCHDVVHIVSSW